MKKGIAVLKVWVVEAILTALLIAFLAFIVLNLRLNDKVIDTIIYVIYAFVNLIGGVLIGKMMAKKKFMWGACNGLLYMAVILMCSIALFGIGHIAADKIILASLISILAATFGGMIS